MRGRAVAWLVAFAALVLLPLTLARADEPVVSDAAEPGATQLEWLGTPPPETAGQRLGPGGFQWGGGSWYALVKRLELEHCWTQALWLPERRLGWHCQAPGFVNRIFTMLYGSGNEIPAGPVAVVCTTEANVRLGPAQPVFSPDAGEVAWILHPRRDVQGRASGAAYIQYGGGTAERLAATLALAGCGTPLVRFEAGGRVEPGVQFAAQERLHVECDSGTSGLIADYGLGETQLRWLLHPETNTQRNKQGQALIQYGGGSLYHLISRLSTQGCNVNEIEIEDTETQRVYEYSFENTNQQNKAFADKYKEHIPQSTLIGITCVDNCDVIYGLDLVEDPQDRELILNLNRGKCKSVDLSQEEWVVSASECTDNWSEGALYFLSRVPVFQNTCKIEVVANVIGGATLSSLVIYKKALFQNVVASLYVAQHKDPSQQIKDIEILYVELHELCHIHQEWYTFKEYIDYDYLKHSSYNNSLYPLWYETPMTQEFNEIVGFSQRDDGTWTIRSDNPYRGIYSREDIYQYFTTDPAELSADLCSFYLLQEIQPNSQYKQYAQPPYITPQIEQWIEKYIVLPPPVES